MYFLLIYLHKGNKHPSVISFLNQFIPNHPFTVAYGPTALSITYSVLV